jgi:hypothetical protein
MNMHMNPHTQSARTIKQNSVVIPGKSTAPGKVPIKLDYHNQTKTIDLSGPGPIHI